MPKELVSEKIIAKRIKVYEEDRMTLHNAARIKLFSKNPRTYAFILRFIEFITLKLRNDYIDDKLKDYIKIHYPNYYKIKQN